MIDNYLVESERTDLKDIIPSMNRMTPKMTRIMHGAIGISTEAGELLDQLKKHIYYGNDLDIINIKEELGDIFFYIAMILRQIDSNFDEITHVNITKLKKRYPEGFDKDKATYRDIDAERQVMENTAK